VAIDPPELVVRFVVPGPPVPKARPRWAPHGHTYTPAATVDGAHRVQQHCFVANPRLRPLPGRYWIEAMFFVGGGARSDIDNYLKQVMDSLNGIAWPDGRAVGEVSARVVLFDPDPRSEIVVWRTEVPATAVTPPPAVP
jgi:Holliday junction resolvase RusA-like endonuclease